ncbi:MAG TPA: GNAT family N-acetyltransferase [Cellvibrionaceae bacterium]|nr:GNAT family N-acetyltransferase [Cellvibrionaceae bacterium]HMW47682.1 GNAT family N-acetyltransferase [Cellvibrionaceae bacterium]HMY39420.1 GNAT family N-acetyltransferase [Marinagarivorans sp.]HNG60473.1 GNAT family N-acetyltransferase [Cellvibrionaceae bacterium]
MCALELPPSKIANALWLVPTTDLHQAFLQRVFTQSRKALWQASGLDAPWIDKLLEDQYNLQQKNYGAQENGRYSYVIAAKGQWVGRLLVRADASTLHIMDIALLPEYQNQGIGQHVLTYLQQQASNRGQLLTLNTDATNRAYHWYLRCGFTVTQQVGIDCAMAWRAPTSADVSHYSLVQ